VKAVFRLPVGLYAPGQSHWEFRKLSRIPGKILASGLDFAFCLFILRFCRFISRFCRFISRFCRFTLRFCRFVSRFCRFISSFCLFISRFCRFVSSLSAAFRTFPRRVFLNFVINV